MRQPAHTLLFASVLLLISGCLTVETKEYSIKLKNHQSGEATIRFVNIQSESDDTLDVTNDDFQQLLDGYFQGNKFEKENPGFRNVKKRLYEEKGVLVGEVTFTFDSLAAVRIFKYDDESPYMYFAGNPVSAEHYLSSNGTVGTQWMPVVFWPKSVREFTIKTKVSSEVSYRKSLLKNFQQWKAEQSKKKQ